MGKLIDVLKSYKGGLVMDSKQKDDIKSVLKYTIIVICIIFVIFCARRDIYLQFSAFLAALAEFWWQN